jgi:hypothetical protein
LIFQDSAWGAENIIKESVNNEGSPSPWINPPAESSNGPMGISMPGGLSILSPFSYKFYWQAKSPVPGQHTDFELNGNALNIFVPVMKGEHDSIMLTTGVDAEMINTSAIFPDSGRPFPDSLWNIHLGLNYMHRLENGWLASAGVNVSSASDQPFGQLRDTTAGILMFLRIPRQENDAINLGIMYAPMSEIQFPIPVVSYLWWPSKELRMNIGLPLQIMYSPYKDLTLDLSYMLIHNIHSQATYRLNEKWNIYTAYDWTNHTWYLSDREDDQEHLHNYAQSLTVGVQSKLASHLNLDLSAGYMFDRYYFTGKNYQDESYDHISIGNCFSLSLKINVM